MIRHCNIAGLDRNACCGTQLPSLCAVGALHVLPPSTPHGSARPAGTPTRLFFVAGPRAARHLRHASRLLSRAAQVAGVGRADLHERLARTERGRFDTAEREKALRAELFRILGQQAAATEGGGDRALVIRRNAPATHDFDALAAIAAAYCDARPRGVVALVSTPPATASAERERERGAPAPAPALLVVQGRDEADAKRVFDAVKTALGTGDAAAPRVKGGGARGRFMAKVERWARADEQALERVMRP